MMVGLALGRIGCLLNGCCYGGESTAPWAITFPRENAPDDAEPPYADQASAGGSTGFASATTAEQASRRRSWSTQRRRRLARRSARGCDAGDVVTAHQRRRRSPALAAAHLAIFDALRDGRSLAVTTPERRANDPRDRSCPPRSLPVHPAQIYSAIDAGLLAWVLWSYYPYRRRDGEVMALMITLHPDLAVSAGSHPRRRVPRLGDGAQHLAESERRPVRRRAWRLWVCLRRKPPGPVGISVCRDATTREPRLAAGSLRMVVGPAACHSEVRRVSPAEAFDCAVRTGNDFFAFSPQDAPTRRQLSP